MPSRTFSPKQYFEKLIRYWWILFLTIVIGGMIGVGLSYLRPPRYEAAAKLSSSIDYTLLPELEDYEEDRIINEAGWVMLSDEVLLSVQRRAKGAGISISFEDMLDRFSADRIDDLWSLRVAGADAQAAADLANLWVDEAYLQLTQAHTAALDAEQARMAITALDACLDGDAQTGADLAICQIEDGDSLADALQSQTNMLTDALVLSRGLNPASNYTLTGYAAVPDHPSYQARGAMAFVGIMLGLTTGLVVLWFYRKKE